MMRCTGKSGFTVVEVVVVALVMSIVALIGIIQVRSLSPAQTLENGVDDLRSVLGLTRSYAHTGHVCCSDQLPNGYGLTFTIDGKPDREASLYADLDSSNTYTSGGLDMVLNTIALPNGVNFTACADSTTTVNAGTCDVFFLIGDAAEVYSNGLSEDSSITITLQHSATALNDTVTINTLGVIE